MSARVLGLEQSGQSIAHNITGSPILVVDKDRVMSHTVRYGTQGIKHLQIGIG